MSRQLPLTPHQINRLSELLDFDDLIDLRHACALLALEEDRLKEFKEMEKWKLLGQKLTAILSATGDEEVN